MIEIAIMAGLVIIALVAILLFVSSRQHSQHIEREYLIRLEMQVKLLNDQFSQNMKAMQEASEALIDKHHTFRDELGKRFTEVQSSQQSAHHNIQKNLTETLNNTQMRHERSLNEFKEHSLEGLNKHRQQFDQHQLKTLEILQNSLQKGMTEIRQQVTENLNQNINLLTKQVEKLTHDTNEQLKNISGQVEKRLTEGFEKTTATFADVLKRLALIDEAQKKITELSSNVVSLQEVLADKRSRGAFGEVQLSSLIQNLIPKKNYAMQYTLKNGKRVDCMLFLPDPTGNIAIDAKFPLEDFQRFTDHDLPAADRKKAEQNFKVAIKKHISDIASKYICPGETSEGAIMFIPAEAIFAEIHSHYPELVAEAQRKQVWLTSPTTMMAILTTALAVLKDAATRGQIHIIQEHLTHLGKDFDRFRKRMDNLERHIDQAYTDVKDVNTSAKKITSRFNKIERVEIDSDNDPEMEFKEKLDE